MLDLSKAEDLVVKYFGATHKQRFYVILGVGFINWMAGAAYGHYLEIAGPAKLWLQEFRFNLTRNTPDGINSILIGSFRSSYKEETGQDPDAVYSRDITIKANAVMREYVALFLAPEED